MRASIGVKRVVALSTDKASSPAICMGRPNSPRTSCSSPAMHMRRPQHALRRRALRQCHGFARIGDPVLHCIAADQGVLPITDARMTRFMISWSRGRSRVARLRGHGRRRDLRQEDPLHENNRYRSAVAPEARHEIVGIRPGEKLHEQMIGSEDARTPTSMTITTRSCRRSTTGAWIRPHQGWQKVRRILLQLRQQRRVDER